jgi:predicted ATPase/class 3 adenylate cyclase
MEFGVLGPLMVREHGEAVEVPGARKRTLLIRFLISPNRLVTSDRLIEDLWDGEPTEKSDRTLQSHVSQLCPYVGGKARIPWRGTGYEFLVGEDDLDVTCFESEFRRGAAALGGGDYARAEALLGAGLDRWRGGALSDVRDYTWAQPEIARLEELRLSALEAWLDALLHLGRHADVVVPAEEALRDNPLREVLWERLMLAYYRCGRQAEAVRAFQRARDALAELGLEPSPTLVELERSVLAQRPELAWRPPATTTGPGLTDGQDLPPLAGEPSGTITLLFTDIEGSTKLWESYEETMSPALARHDEVVRRALQEHGGHVFKTVGDAFCAAFAAASDAVRAAVAIQRSIWTEDWPEHVQIRVRIGLHTGECERRDGDYFGPSVNRASRLMNTTHGGQTLLTRLTAELVRSSLPPNAALKDLGILRLKDLGHPEQVFQLEVPGLPADFPPLGLVERGYDELPAELTTLIGREKLADQILEDVKQKRLVTLKGPGGVGKTRLAVRVAAVVRQPFEDGVRFVDLTQVHGDGPVADVILSALHGGTTLGESPTDAVVRVLRPARALLVLDSCEHQLGRVRPIVAAVLQHCPWVHVLATSRQAIGVQGEHSLEVPPLEVPLGAATDPVELQSSPAAQLFALHAHMLDTQFAVSADNAGPIAEICRRLDGVPLAIELAARQLDLITLEQLAQEATDGQILDRLTQEAVLHERLGSIAASLQWSFNLLSRVEQDLFLSLGTFAGTFTREQALDLFDPQAGPDLARCFDRLVRLSMVTREAPGTPRFRLFAPSREFARGTLSPAEYETQHGQHAKLMLRAAEEFGPMLRTSREAEACLRLSADFPDHRQAVAWFFERSVEEAARMVVALFQFCQFHLLSEANEWALRLTELIEDDSALATPVCGAAALGCWFSGDVDGAIRLSERAIRAAPSPRDPSTLWAHLALIDAYGYSGRVEQTAEHFEALVAYSRQSGDAFWTVNSLGFGAIGRLLFGDTDGAMRRVDRAVALARDLNNPDCIHWAMHCLGRVLAASGELDAACLAFEEAMDAAGSVGSRWNLSLDLLEWSSLKWQVGDLPRAAQGLLEVLELLVASGNRSQLSQCYLETAHVLAEHGDTEAAFIVLTARSGMPAMPMTPGVSDEAFAQMLEEKAAPSATALRVRARRLTEGDLIVLCRSTLEAVVQSERRAARRA